jgi:hypothetical protein
LAVETLDRAFNLAKKLFKEKKSKDEAILKVSMEEVVITYYSIYDKNKRYREGAHILEEYVELSKEMFGLESTQHAYSHFLIAKSIMMNEYSEEEGDKLLGHI